MRFSRYFLSPVLFVLIGLSTAAVAKADVYLITNSNFAGNQNFGSITTTLVGNSIQVNVQLTAGWVLHGQGVGFNVVDPDGAVSVTGISSAFFTWPGGSGNLDGFGSFSYSVAGPTTAVAQANNLNSVTFTVNSNRNAGAGFTNANQLEELSNQGWWFAVQIAPSTPGGATGFAASNTRGVDINPLGNVPEPASMILFGSGLMGLAAGIRRRRSRKN